MVLVRHRVEQRCDAAAIVVETEVGGRDDWRGCVPRLEHVRKDADQVARLLGLRRNEHLILEQQHEVRRERPRLEEFGANALVFRRRHVGESQVLGDVHRDRGFDLLHGNLHAVIEQTVQQQTKAITPLRRAP